MLKQHEEMLLYNKVLFFPFFFFFFHLMCFSDTGVILLLELLSGPGMVKLKMCGYSADLNFNAFLCGP